jgi:hypothetical protein
MGYPVFENKKTMGNKEEFKCKIGDIFNLNERYYLLACSGFKEIALININSGNRFSDSVKFDDDFDMDNIDYAKFQMLCGSRDVDEVYKNKIPPNGVLTIIRGG